MNASNTFPTQHHFSSLISFMLLAFPLHVLKCTRFAGEEITKIFFYFAWHEYAEHPSGNEKKSWSDLSEEAKKQSESPEKARVSHRRLQVHAVVIFKQFKEDSKESGRKKGKDLLILVRNSHLRFLFVFTQKNLSSSEKKNLQRCGIQLMAETTFLSLCGFVSTAC